MIIIIIIIIISVTVIIIVIIIGKNVDYGKFAFHCRYTAVLVKSVDLPLYHPALVHQFLLQNRYLPRKGRQNSQTSFQGIISAKLVVLIF